MDRLVHQMTSEDLFVECTLDLMLRQAVTTASTFCVSFLMRRRRCLMKHFLSFTDYIISKIKSTRLQTVCIITCHKRCISPSWKMLYRLQGRLNVFFNRIMFTICITDTNFKNYFEHYMQFVFTVQMYFYYW